MITKFREVIAKASEKNSGYVIFVNPFDKDGGIVTYDPKKDWLEREGTIIALDTIKNISVHNGHFKIEIPFWNDELDEWKPLVYHIYVTKVADVNEF